MNSKGKIPVVSILMPFANSEKYIGIAIESLLQQTHGNWELIAINENSHDMSYNIIKSFQDKRIKVIQSEGKGISNALNSGLKVCKGEYIARMDADDACSPERLERQLIFLRDHPHISIVGSACQYFGERNGRTYPFKDKIKMIEYLSVANPLLHASILFRRSLLDHAMYFYDPNFSGDEDYNLWIKLLLDGIEIANLDDVLYFYRIYHNNAHGDKVKNREIKTRSVSYLLENLGYQSNKEIVKILIDYHFDHKVKFRRVIALRAFVKENPNLKKVFGPFNIFLVDNVFQFFIVISRVLIRRALRFVRMAVN